MTNFEKFVRTSRRYYGDPVATISKNKYIGLNSLLMETYVKENDYAVLYFDREKELIGIKIFKGEQKEGYKIRKYRSGRMGTVSITGFLMHFGISHDRTLSYSVDWDEKENMLIIDLKEPLKDKHK